jgi:hypothetical protein
MNYQEIYNLTDGQNKIRTTIAEKSYQDAIDNLRESYNRTEDVVNYVWWTVSRNPFIGAEVPNHSNYYVWETESGSLTPKFAVLYHFDQKTNDNTVTMIRIVKVDDIQDD